ncbi:hypothetical protein LEMLEM_LOCUS20168 [Lemmus lemmus]
MGTENWKTLCLCFILRYTCLPCLSALWRPHCVWRRRAQRWNACIRMSPSSADNPRLPTASFCCNKSPGLRVPRLLPGWLRKVSALNGTS